MVLARLASHRGASFTRWVDAGVVAPLALHALGIVAWCLPYLLQMRKKSLIPAERVPHLCARLGIVRVDEANLVVVLEVSMWS